MVPFRLPKRPDRQAILHFITTMQPRAGRIIGALSGMILAGAAWLYGLCVGLLLGYMVDTVRAKATPGSAGTTGSAGPTGSGGTAGEAPADNDASEGESGHSPACRIKEMAAPYHRLGLLPGASMAEVKKAWRIQSRQAHPDAPGGAAEDFMSLKTAYEKIMEQRKTDTASQ